MCVFYYLQDELQFDTNFSWWWRRIPQWRIGSFPNCTDCSLRGFGYRFDLGPSRPLILSRINGRPSLFTLFALLTEFCVNWKILYGSWYYNKTGDRDGGLPCWFIVHQKIKVTRGGSKIVSNRKIITYDVYFTTAQTFHFKADVYYICERNVCSPTSRYGRENFQRV